MAESISLPELALIGISSSFFAGGLETVCHKWAVFLRLQTLLLLSGGVGSSMAGLVAGLVAGVVGGHRVGSTKRFVVFASNRNGRIRFHLMADKIFQMSIILYMQLCLSKRNVRFDKNTASPAWHGLGRYRTIDFSI